MDQEQVIIRAVVDLRPKEPEPNRQVVLNTHEIDKVLRLISDLKYNSADQGKVYCGLEDMAFLMSDWCSHSRNTKEGQ